MATLQAWQHIYSNVEKEQSPQGRGGFQTLFFSQAGLTESEIEELEGRMLYFASDIEPVKQVFFKLDSGKRVVSQLVPLNEADQYGRKGRYLAHSYIFDSASLAPLDHNPFPILKQAPFITKVADALAQGNFATGHIAPTSLNVTAPARPAIKATAGWHKQALQSLVLMALRSESMIPERRAISIFGSPTAVAETIEAALFAVPTDLRATCSFDTYFHRCNLVATYFWAVGYPSKTGNPTFDQVDADTKQIKQIANPQPYTAYERWAVAQILSGNLGQLEMLRDVAWPLCQWLDNGANNNKLLNGLELDIVQSVFKANEELVQNGLRQKIAKLVPPELIDRVFPVIYNSGNHRANFEHLRTGFTIPQLLNLLYQEYQKQTFAKPGDSEVAALGRTLDKVESHPLQPIQVTWDGSRRKLQQHLETIQPDAYQSFVQTALNSGLGEPLYLLTKAGAPIFVEHLIASPAINRINLNDLVDELIAFGQLSLLEPLTPQITKQEDGDIRKLAKQLKKEKDVPPTFQKSLGDTLAKLPDTMGTKVLKTLKNPFSLFD